MGKKEEKKELNVLHAIYGKNTFLKIKQWLIGGDQIIFSFVDRKNHNNDLDCYLSSDDMAVFVNIIKNGTLMRKLNNKEIGYTSPFGGNATGGPNNSPMSRNFTITKGNNIIITGSACPAIQTDIGAFIPKKGTQPFKKVSVPITEDDLFLIQKKWGYLEADYFKEKYSLKNMQMPQFNNVPDTCNDTAPVENTEIRNTNNSSTDIGKNSCNEKNITFPEGIFTKQVSTRSELLPLNNDKESFAIKVLYDDQVVNVIFYKDCVQKLPPAQWTQFIRTVKKLKTPFQANFLAKNGNLYFQSFTV